MSVLLQVIQSNDLIVVFSFAFQISGAVILLLWSLTHFNKKVERMCQEKSEILVGRFDKSGTYTVLPKKTLQKNAREVCRNICAFANLLIGYTCAIFAADAALPRCLIFAGTMLATVLILAVESMLIYIFSLLRYRTDRKVFE